MTRPAVLALQFSIRTPELAERMRDRLSDPKAPASSSVVWERDSRRVLLEPESLTVRTVDGWLLCQLDAHSDATGTATLQFVFYLGTGEDGAGVQAAATINAADLESARLADMWGEDVQRVLWDGVLDAIEASLQQAAETDPGGRLILGGFHCDGDTIGVDVFIEEA